MSLDYFVKLFSASFNIFFFCLIYFISNPDEIMHRTFIEDKFISTMNRLIENKIKNMDNLNIKFIA